MGPTGWREEDMKVYYKEYDLGGWGISRSEVVTQRSQWWQVPLWAGAVFVIESKPFWVSRLPAFRQELTPLGFLGDTAKFKLGNIRNHQRKRWLTYKGMAIRLNIDFTSQTIDTRKGEVSCWKRWGKMTEHLIKRKINDSYQLLGT